MGLTKCLAVAPRSGRPRRGGGGRCGRADRGLRRVPGEPPERERGVRGAGARAGRPLTAWAALGLVAAEGFRAGSGHGRSSSSGRARPRLRRTETGAPRRGARCARGDRRREPARAAASTPPRRARQRDDLDACSRCGPWASSRPRRSCRRSWPRRRSPAASRGHAVAAGLERHRRGDPGAPCGRGGRCSDRTRGRRALERSRLATARFLAHGGARAGRAVDRVGDPGASQRRRSVPARPLPLPRAPAARATEATATRSGTGRPRSG